MKFTKTLLIAASCVMMMGATSAFAAENAAEPAQPTKLIGGIRHMLPAKADQVQITRGEIVEIDGDKIVVKGEGNQKVVAAMVSDKTYIVNGKNGKEKALKNLKVGQKVTAYYSSVMTRSLPPQSRAYAIVLNRSDEKNLHKDYQFFAVEKATLAEDGKSIRVLNTNNDLIATIDADACKDFAKIKAGDKLLLKYSIVAMSLPGLTNAEKAIILPEK